ncbi:Tn3 family transposase [Streptomyces sp. NPDC048258]|uniref:Tn3 family transposase n=1 Tax=Streptomyces sp. NPDC048258 TaxID=3365527 RepID=UPI0037140090
MIACLIGLSTNLGLNGMAASCGIPYDVLAWTAEWYIREVRLIPGSGHRLSCDE